MKNILRDKNYTEVLRRQPLVDRSTMLLFETPLMSSWIALNQIIEKRRVRICRKVERSCGYENNM